MSVLFCDSNCELDYRDAKEFGLRVIKMPYVLDGEEYYYDLGEKTDFNLFYKKMREGSMPKTAALNAYDYVNYFEDFLKDGEDILYLTFSHKLSGTFQFLDEAISQLKVKYPERSITTFDTKGISMCSGFQVYYAAKLKQQGASDKEILDFLSDFTKRVSTYFVVDDLNHLKRGGRISSFKANLGTMLGLKPLITLTDEGALENVGKIKGSKKVISELCELVRNKKADDFDKYAIWILHADCLTQAEELKRKLLSEIGQNLDVRIQLVGPVIATHCGPGTLAVIFKGKSRT